MKTLNDQVAVLPIQFGHNSGQSERLVAGLNVSDKAGRTLVKTTVAFDSEKFKKGQSVFFRAEIAQHGFSKTKLIHASKDGDIEFTLLPESLAVAVE